MNILPAILGRTTRRAVLGALGAGAVVLTMSGPALAQTRAPDGNVEIAVGTSPGGTPDVIMRQVARILNDLGIVENPLVVQNRTGGSWAISSEYVIGREGDENLIYAIAQPVFTTPITQGTDTYYDRLTPIAFFVQGDLLVVASADSEGTLEDYIESAREDPLSVSFSGAQAGSTDQIAVALLESAAEVEFNYIPYDGGGAALASFLGGNADLTVLPPNEALELIESGDVRPLAILNSERREEAELADIPTAGELGYDAIWGQAWGVAGPPNMDPELAQWWSDRFEELVETEEWRAIAGENFWRRDFVGLDGADEEMERMHVEHLDVLRALDLALL